MRDALKKIEWPGNTEVMSRFGLVLSVLLALLVILAVVDGVFGYVLGLIY